MQYLGRHHPELIDAYAKLYKTAPTSPAPTRPTWHADRRCCCVNTVLVAPIGPSMPRGHEPPHDRLGVERHPAARYASATQSSFECAASERKRAAVAALRLNQLSLTVVSS